MVAGEDQHERTHLLVQAHMWMMLMAQTERRFGHSHQGRWKDITKELKELLTDGVFQYTGHIPPSQNFSLHWYERCRVL